MVHEFLRFTNWAEKNWIQLVIMMVILLLLFLILVLFSWLYGYWYDGIHSTRQFDTSSCWSGVTVVGTALGSVALLAKAAWTKYSQDSQFNTAHGCMPYSTLSSEGNLSNTVVHTVENMAENGKKE